MPYINFDSEIEIGVEEFVNSCNKRELKELIEVLKNNGRLNDLDDDIEGIKSLDEMEWDNIVEKLRSRRFQLSNEEKEIISNIVKNY